MLHRGDGRTQTTKQVRETEAEAVAFVVCQSVGLQNGTASQEYIQFGLGPDMDSDPVCFDIKSGTNSKDYRIVKIDHGEILCSYRVKVVKEIAPGFRHLVLQTIERANSIRE
jgi:hypothetical protein